MEQLGSQSTNNPIRTILQTKHLFQNKLVQGHNCKHARAISAFCKLEVCPSPENDKLAVAEEHTRAGKQLVGKPAEAARGGGEAMPQLF